MPNELFDSVNVPPSPKDWVITSYEMSPQGFPSLYICLFLEAAINPDPS